jgi:hypothetical protein
VYGAAYLGSSGTNSSVSSVGASSGGEGNGSTGTSVLVSVSAGDGLHSILHYTVHNRNGHYISQILGTSNHIHCPLTCNGFVEGIHVDFERCEDRLPLALFVRSETMQMRTNTQATHLKQIYL